MIERKLVTIDVISELNPIPEMDRIELATIRGWEVIVKKGEFSVGDKCIYFEIDSLIPAGDERFEFLRERTYLKNEDAFRIRTMKMRGIFSQGLALPITQFPEFKNLQVGVDITNKLNVRLYDPSMGKALGDEFIGENPHFIPDTSLPRIQNEKSLLTTYSDKTIIITEKIDGTSQTYFVKDNEFGMCSRNNQLAIPKDENEWKGNRFLMCKRYDIKNKLLSLGRNLAIQGEIVGKQIQKGQYGNEFYAFRVYDIDNREFLHILEAERFCKNLCIPFVPVIEKSYPMFKSIKEAVEFSDLNSLVGSKKAEGIVCTIETGKRALKQFKVISPTYLTEVK